MAMLKFITCLALLAVSLENVRAHLSEETKEAFRENLKVSFNECAKEFNVDLDEFKKQAKSDTPLGTIDKCFYRCFITKRNAINDEGKYDPKSALETLKTMIKNEDDIKYIENAMNSCVSVNDEEVSDGKEGCDRAVLLFTCFKKQRAALV